MKNNIKISLLFVLGVIFLTVCSSKSVFATSVSGNCYFQDFECTINHEDYGGPDTDWKGNDLFSGRDQAGNGTVLSKDITKGDLISFIEGKASGVSDKERMSAAYIKIKMTNNDAGTWVSRMNNPDIGVKPGMTTSTDKTTFFYQGSPSYDILEAGSTIDVVKDVVVIYSISHSSTIYAKIEVDCGNMLANPIPLPDPIPWAVAVSATINKTTAVVGDTIIWTHGAEITGTGTTDANVDYSYKNIDGWSGSGLLGTINSGSSAGVSQSANSPTYTAALSDVGKKLCRVTTAKPKSKGHSGTITSTPKQCVTVVSSPPPTAVSVCRPWVLAVEVPTDAESEDLVPVSITGTDTTDPSVPQKSWSTTDSTFDITTDCTNGDVWKFHFEADPYVLYWYWSCWPSSDYCSPHHVDVWATTSQRNWDSSEQGPCFDYILTAGVKPLNDRVEVNSIIQNITPTLSSDSWTKYNNSSFYSTIVNGVPYNTHTKTKATKWQISRLTIPPNNPVPSLKNTSPGVIGSDDNPSALDPQAYFAAAGWESIKTGVAVFKKDGKLLKSVSGDNPFAPFNDTVDDLPAGTKVCFAFSVKSASSDPGYNSFELDDTWNHSALNSDGYGIETSSPIQQCVIVVKKPKVQVWGGDLSVGKTYGNSAGNANASISTTTSVKPFGTFGSWDEYGIFATKTIFGMASGAAFNGGLGITDVSGEVCDFSKLTFTNAEVATCSSDTEKGNYNSHRAIPDVAASFAGGDSNFVPSAVAQGVQPVSDLASGIYTSNGNVTLSLSTLLPGKSIILKVHGTVNIIGNQTYSPNNNGVNYTGISQLPQLVIIADDDINISGNVTQIDAWLIAKAKINTCIEGGETTPLTANMCSDLLTVNGPVMAQRLFLRRTAGSGTDAANSGDPAEIFNLRADTYLWSFARATSSGRIQTVYTTELPSRL